MKTAQRHAALFAIHRIKALRLEFAIHFTSEIVFAMLALLPAQLLHFFSVRLADLNDANLSPSLLKMGLAGLAIAVCLSAAAFGRNYCREWLLLRLESHLRLAFVDRIHQSSLETIARSDRGDWLARISSDIRATEDFLGTSLPNFLYDLALVLGTTALLTYYSGAMAAAILAAALVLGWINYIIQVSLAPRLEELRALYGGLLQILLENLEGWKTIRSYGAARFERRRAEQKLLHYRTCGMTAASLIGKSFASGEFVTHLLIAVCLVALGYQVSHHQLTIAGALFYPFYLTQFLFSTKGLVMSANDWSRYRVSGSRLYAAFHESENTRITLSKDLLGYRNYEITVSDLKIPFNPDHGALYQSVALRLVQHRITVLMGASGCGKSTLLEILSGLRQSPDGVAEIYATGTRLWSSTKGPLTMPTELFSYVEQKPYLFEGSLRTNLTLGREEFTDADLLNALELVGLRDVFEKRGGLDLVVSCRGENVSEGQLYRIGLARALLLKRPFLLLDEPFAALDNESIDLVASTLSRLKSRVGILMVTHQVPDSLAVDETKTFYKIGQADFTVSLIVPRGAEQPEAAGYHGRSVALALSPQ